MSPPDSFSDGGRFTRRSAAIDEVAAMIDAGVDIVDVGGESTRPGAEAVSAEQELTRVVPVIEAIRARFDTPMSIDTMKPEVMTAATDAGASMINDVNALEAEGALKAAGISQGCLCVSCTSSGRLKPCSTIQTMCRWSMKSRPI